MNKQHKRLPKSFKRVMILMMVSVLVYMCVPTLGFADTYIARIMQGDSNSASDCVPIFEGLVNSGSYSSGSITTKGWAYPSPNKVYPITDYSQFLESSSAQFAYYSGHGASSGGYPILNASSGPVIDVATILNVKGSNWINDCVWKPYHNIRVLMLASCNQLNKDYAYQVRTYARIMRASGIRAITGFHMRSPVDPIDERQARIFMGYANNGNSVRFSWEIACTTAKDDYGNTVISPWAALVYRENSNEFYRIPGFPGNQYPTPSPDAIVYRYRQGLSGYEVAPTATATNTSSSSEPLPLYITTTAASTQNISFTNREPVDPEYDLPKAASLEQAKQTIQKMLTDTQYQNSVCMSAPVIRDEVSTEDDGSDANTDVIVERQYFFYNTFRNVRIADAMINIAVDKNGVGRVINDWKEVNLSASDLSSGTSLLSKEDAFSIVNNDPKYAEAVRSSDPVYASIGNGVHKLKYEVILSGGTTLYVDAENGKIEKLTKS